jgi:hypothetical protein
MKIVYKILLLSILSFSVPIGRLFEIFNWNDRIITTETVFRKKQFGTKGGNYFFLKIVKKIEKTLSTHFQDKYNFVTIEKNNTVKTKLSIFIQKNRTFKFEVQLIRRFIFNMLFMDDSEHLILSCS